MSFPTKSQRQSCWDSRDRYWECLDANKIDPEQPDPVTCKQFRQLFESSCPGQWVKHFDRKRSYNIFKMKIESDGYYEPLSDKNSSDTKISLDGSRKQKPFKRMEWIQTEEQSMLNIMHNYLKQQQRKSTSVTLHMLSNCEIFDKCNNSKGLKMKSITQQKLNESVIFDNLRKNIP